MLPLTLDTYWRPIRIDCIIMELLTLPTSPLPKKLSFKLARVLSEEPGIHGEKWHVAINEAVADIENAWIEQGLETKQVNKRKKELLEKIDIWVNHEYFDTTDGLPCSIIEDICPSPYFCKRINCRHPCFGHRKDQSVSTGSHVKRRNYLLITEAMKMETTVQAPTEGIVREIHVQAGDSTKIGSRKIE